MVGDDILPLDSEEKAARAIGALNGLATLIERLCPGTALDPEDMAPLLRLVTQAAIEVIPNYGPRHPVALNDRQ